MGVSLMSASNYAQECLIFHGKWDGYYYTNVSAWVKRDGTVVAQPEYNRDLVSCPDDPIGNGQLVVAQKPMKIISGTPQVSGSQYLILGEKAAGDTIGKVYLDRSVHVALYFVAVPLDGQTWE